MIYFTATMQHNEQSFEALSRMQYDLFCKKNRIARTLISIAAIVFGLINSSEWWGILVIGYGCYLTTSTYSSANHRAHKLAAGIKKSGMDFPSSQFLFQEKEVIIRPLSGSDMEQSTLAYQDILRLGEDSNYYYLFRNQYGGYMIPKKELPQDAAAFRNFMEKAANQRFRSHTAPIVKLITRLQTSGKRSGS